jgi:hypothetical protein
MCLCRISEHYQAFRIRFPEVIHLDYGLKSIPDLNSQLQLADQPIP